MHKKRQKRHAWRVIWPRPLRRSQQSLGLRRWRELIEDGCKLCAICHFFCLAVVELMIMFIGYAADVGYSEKSTRILGDKEGSVRTKCAWTAWCASTMMEGRREETLRRDARYYYTTHGTIHLFYSHVHSRNVQYGMHLRVGRYSMITAHPNTGRGSRTHSSCTTTLTDTMPNRFLVPTLITGMIITVRTVTSL